MKSVHALLGAILVLLVQSLSAQSITVSATQTEIAVAPGFNHAPLRLGLTYQSNSPTDLARLTATSDGSWTSGTIDTTNAQLILSFTTASLINRSYTATITISDGTNSTQVFVRATISPLNVTCLVDDPVRSRTYGIQQDGTNVGSIVAIDPLSLTPIHNLTVGKRPTDLAISADGNEMLVINSIDKSISVIDLQTSTVRETISLSSYYDWSSTGETSGHVKYGAGDVIYYIDGSWGPVLHVFNRSTRTVLQSIFFDGTAYAGAGNSASGFGDFVLLPDKSVAFGWSQYGWSAGSADSSAGKFTVNADGTLTKAALAQVPGYPNGIVRDPLNTPALRSADGQIVFLKQYAFDTANFATATRTFPGPVFAISHDAEIVSTQSAIYEYATGNKLYDLPVSSTVQTITSDYARLVYFDSAAKALKSVNLFEEIGTDVLGRESSPANKAIVLPPSELQWASVAGVDLYRVYLGESQSAVEQADPSSPTLLGTASGNSIALTSTLEAGKTYYWRVDVVTDAEVVAGPVQSFTVSSIASNVSSVDAATVRGHTDYAVGIELSSASPGESWSASSPASWVTFAADSGTTPATLRAFLDASAVEPGITQTDIKVTGPTGTVSIPVRLQVDPLALTVIRSDPDSSMVYAISETASSSAPVVGTLQAYLLAIDSQTQSIKRVATVGRSATDLAIHHGDNRIYVTNWMGGSLLALNLDTFALERTYTFQPFGGVGYGNGDVYRIAAGGPGRLLVEEEDQWIDIAVFDTVNGTLLGKAFVREGGGQYAPDKRYYYHGENNSSGAEILKFDTLADSLTEVAHARGNISSYYGSRTVVVSEDGKRVFWSGVVYTADLAEEWALGEIIYSTSRDGRYAFAETKIHDVNERKVAFGMPVSTKVSAFNSITNKLVLQKDQRIAFYALSTGTTLPTPLLSGSTVTATTVEVTWVQDALQTGFTLQMRQVGTDSWSDVSSSIASSVSEYTVTGLTATTPYEFRIKADSASASSSWSNVVTATTLPMPPSTPSFSTTAGPYSVTLTWSVAGAFDSVTIERMTSGSQDGWAAIATVSSPATTYTDTGLTTSTTYVYRLKATRDGIDSAYSYEAWVTLYPPSAPTISWQPSSRSVLSGTRVTFYVSAYGNPLPTFQWYKDGVAIPGATNATFTITAASMLDAGVYKVVASNSAGSVTSSEATLEVSESTSRMVNFSILANVDAGSIVTVGFYIAGGSKTVLLRGMGPTLSKVGVTDFLSDPRLTLFHHAPGGAIPILANDDWSSAINKSELVNATAQFTGLPFISDPSHDAAILPTLDSGSGYSAQISSGDGASGQVLVEVYDTQLQNPARLSNISALTRVAPGKPLTTGFIITGNSKRKVLIRGVGPGLVSQGVKGELPDPQLVVYRNTTPIAGNNDWSAAENKAEIIAISNVTVGLKLDDPSKDAVVVLDLEAGLYTAQVTSADGASGLALVELYDVP